jgi:hypothetical protein
VRHAEFRDQLEGALREVGLFLLGRRVELIDLEDGSRRWNGHVHRTAPANAEPFHVFAAIEWEWSPVDAARAYTCEEDLLTELLGERARIPRTARRWIRLDLSFHATLPYGSTTTIPEPHVLGGWTAAVVKRADAAFTRVQEKGGRVVAVLGGHGDLTLQAQCSPDGVVSLSAVEISGFRMVPVPRVWDDPARRDAEADPSRELVRLARAFKTALDGWTDDISALATWIRYSPPPPGAQPVSPRFADPGDDDDEPGPETMH